MVRSRVFHTRDKYLQECGCNTWNTHGEERVPQPLQSVLSMISSSLMRGHTHTQTYTYRMRKTRESDLSLSMISPCIPAIHVKFPLLCCFRMALCVSVFKVND